MRLESLARDYSWWTEAVVNLVFDFSADWARTNLGAWLHDNSNVARTFVVGPGDQAIYGSLDGKRIVSDSTDWKVDAFRALAARARALPNDPNASTSAYVRLPDGVYLLAASKLLLVEDPGGHAPYTKKAILLVGRRIDADLLGAIETKFGLPAMSLAASVATGGAHAHVPLAGPDGRPVAYVSWAPPRPGRHLVASIALPLGVAFAVTAALIGWITLRARRAGQQLEMALAAEARVRREMEFMARHDMLTQLPNRALFMEHLEVAVAQAVRNGSGFAVHYLDLDGFKQVNDTLGHPAGDALLCRVADTMRGVVRAADTIARFGGDEFAVLQRDVADRNAAALFANRLVEQLGQTFGIDVGRTSVRASVGTTLYTQGVGAKVLLRQADQALYRAKREGGNGYRFYDPGRDDVPS